MFKDPLKRYSRYDDFRRLAGKLNILLCTTDPPETHQKYAHVTLPTKILLSKGVSGKTFPDLEKKKKRYFFTNWIANGNPVANDYFA